MGVHDIFVLKVKHLWLSFILNPPVWGYGSRKVILNMYRRYNSNFFNKKKKLEIIIQCQGDGA